MTNTTALEVRVVGAALVSKVDVAEIAPRVAEGIPPALPFIASAISDSAANPTDGGLYRKTEYTFFKNVSPIIQEGVPPDAVIV